MVEANASALEVLRGRQGALCDRDGVLRARLAADDDRLQMLLREALRGGGQLPSGGSMTVQCGFGRARLGLHVNPVDGAEPDFGGRQVAVLVLLVDPGNRPCIENRPGWRRCCSV